MAPHEAAQYRERSVAERFNSRLKEDFGAGNVMVRGAEKVRLHLMSGVIALFAGQLLKLISEQTRRKKATHRTTGQVCPKFDGNSALVHNIIIVYR